MTRYGLPVLFSLMVVTAAAAQPGPPPGPGGPPPGMRGGGDLRETVEIYMIHQMKEALELTDEQSLQVLDLFKERREAMRSVHEGRRELMSDTRALLDDPVATDGEFRRALRQEEELRQREMKVHETFQEGLEKVLTPRQQIQFRFFERRFEEGLRRRIEHMRREGQGREQMEQRRQRLERLRETDPERYEELRKRIEARRDARGERPGGP